MISELRDILFLDIETAASTYDFQSLDERLKVQWARKANYLRRDTNPQTDEELFHERAGIYAEFGKIICIAVGKFIESESGELVLKTKAYYGDDEKSLLIEFKAMLEKTNGSTRLCAHNGREFDFPYLCRRMLVNAITLPAVLDLSGKKPWEVQHLDTMELWKFGDYKNYTSLDLLAAIFNIPSSKDGIDGSMVNHVYHVDKDLVKIKDYCLRDVVVLASLFLKLRGVSLEKEFIVIS